MTLSNPDRPKFQQTELGPVLNHVANRIFESTPTAGLNCFGYGQQQDPVPDIEIFERVVAASHNALLDNSANYIASLAPVRKMFFVQTLQGGLTFYKNPDEIVNEGIKSGLVVPANAVLTLLAEQQGVGYDRDDDLAIAFDDVSRILADRRFQNALVRLAKAPNGSYRNSSVHIAPLGSSLLLPDLCTKGPVFNGFNLDKKVKEFLKAKLEEKREKTDGCPVRKATYPDLGSYADMYAESLGISPDELRVQKASAIVMGAKYLSKVFASVDK